MAEVTGTTLTPPPQVPMANWSAGPVLVAAPGPWLATVPSSATPEVIQLPRSHLSGG